jgi:uncharacterized coiled-coil DUF342 family protein
VDIEQLWSERENNKTIELSHYSDLIDSKTGLSTLLLLTVKLKYELESHKNHLDHLKNERDELYQVAELRLDELHRISHERDELYQVAEQRLNEMNKLVEVADRRHQELNVLTQETETLRNVADERRNELNQIKSSKIFKLFKFLFKGGYQ